MNPDERVEKWQKRMEDSLVQSCPGCDHKIARNAMQCPHCGYKLKTYTGNILAGLLIAGLIVWLLLRWITH